MAGGKMNARQKMINLMYLVFIAMLALNMSKEVLSAFGYTNQKLESTNQTTTIKNNKAYDNLSQKAKDEAAQWGKQNEKATKIRKYSNDFYSYLEALKETLFTRSGIEDKSDFVSMDKTDVLDSYFFIGDGYTSEGQEFLENINNYRENLIKELGSNSIFVPSIKSKFNTDDVFNTKDQKNIPFMKARYEGFPMVASLTNFTQIQTDIRSTESDILSSLLGDKLETITQITGSNYKGIVSLNKSSYFVGEQVKGQVVLGRYDSNLVPTKVTLDGKDITDKVENGQVMLDMPAGSVGDKNFKGVITFMQDGKESPIPFESNFKVIAQPKNAVVSADKMNVVYRGLVNPISISLPGVGDKDIKVTVSSGKLKKKGKLYEYTPSNTISVKTVKFTVKARLENQTITSTAEFRVKSMPNAMASVRGQYGLLRLPKSSLVKARIGAGRPSFEFDLKLKVNSFKIKVPGETTIVVKGTKLNAAAIRAVNRAKDGDVITIFGVDQNIIGNSYDDKKKVLPISIEIVN
jgi:gliding motility-associated protein GldM